METEYMSDLFFSSRRLLLVLKRANRLRIPFEQAFDHIASTEVVYRTGVGSRSLSCFRSRVQAGEDPIQALSDVAPQMMPPSLAAMLSFAERRGNMEPLLNELCPEITVRRGSVITESYWSVYIMLFHGLGLFFLAWVVATILPKLKWAFVGNAESCFLPEGVVRSFAPFWVVGVLGLVTSCSFIVLFMKFIWSWVWYSGVSGMSRCWVRNRSWEVARMCSAVAWMTHHGASEAEALQELLSALPEKSPAAHTSVAKALTVAESGATWDEISSALISFAGRRAVASGSGLPADCAPGVWAESFFLRIRMATFQRYRVAAIYLLPLETGLLGGLSGWVLFFSYRFIQSLTASVM